MAVPEPFSASLKFLAEFRSTLIALGKDYPFLLSAMGGFVLLFLSPTSQLPPSLVSFQGLFGILGLCVALYIGLRLYFDRAPIRRLKRHLKELGEDEILALQPYLIHGMSVRYFDDPWDGPMGSLILKGILSYVDHQIPAFDIPVMIQPVAAAYLREHPYLIGLQPKDVGCESARKKAE